MPYVPAAFLKNVKTPYTNAYNILTLTPYHSISLSHHVARGLLLGVGDAASMFAVGAIPGRLQFWSLALAKVRERVGESVGTAGRLGKPKAPVLVWL